MFPRRPLNSPFAVLLMRSAYETVDELDFIPMNDFQKKFWKLRASEQEAYKLQYEPLVPRIGDISDALYFDFISFSQFSTIAREIPNGQQVFREYCEECPDGWRVVRRDASISDNALLPALFFAKTGDRIFTGLRDGFRGNQFGGPPAAPPGAPLSEVVAGVRKLMDVMVENGYALKAEVADVDEASRSFVVRLLGPANLWGETSLNFRRSPVVNCYDVMAVDAYLRASGRAGTFELTPNPSGCEVAWRLTA
ncbi:hypothetical protein HYH03_011788 [Edaphochlamys debaryana]|uniref:Uncharacterized protein n=1 Tax=Edaphochlamys debaryana TaxID=47281 RepID=A0A835Y229_9CHLO|nr:hypothetical protein HYH03_011788 [Edaphochlamys debaryana]|eukprot:KAG2489679.1 hypothetical protein HYH03_011788 [Edaphochlamys debaryana]